MRVEIDRTQFDPTGHARPLERTGTPVPWSGQAGLDWPQIDPCCWWDGPDADGRADAPTIDRQGARLLAVARRSGGPRGGPRCRKSSCPGGGDKPSCDWVNVNSHSLGVVGIHPKSGQRGDVLDPEEHPRRQGGEGVPASKADMRGVSVPVVEGESERPEECILLGKSLRPNCRPDCPKGLGSRSNTAMRPTGGFRSMLGSRPYATRCTWRSPGRGPQSGRRGDLAGVC